VKHLHNSKALLLVRATEQNGETANQKGKQLSKKARWQLRLAAANCLWLFDVET